MLRVVGQSTLFARGLAKRRGSVAEETIVNTFD